MPAFIDRFYGEFMSPAERQLLVSGLDEIAGVTSPLDEGATGLVSPDGASALVELRSMSD